MKKGTFMMNKKLHIVISTIIFTLLLSQYSGYPVTGSAFSAPDGFVFGIKGGYSSLTGYYGDKFNSGISFGLLGDYYTSLKNLFWEMEFNYGSFDMKVNPESSLTDLSFLIGPLYMKNINRYFQPFIGILGGGSYMTLKLDALDNEETTFKPTGSAKIGFITNLMRGVPFRIEGAYRLNQLSGELYQNYQVGISTMIRSDIFNGPNNLGRKESLIQITDIKLNPIFGARYGSYKEGNIGTVVVENVGRNPLYEIRVETDIAEITDNSTSTKSIKELRPGRKVTLAIPVAITKNILEIQEERDLAIRFNVVYKTKRGIFSYVEHDTILVHSKNSITWNNTAHLGSFITPREEVISEFARESVSALKRMESRGIPKKLQQAIYLFDVLGSAGISYVTDPNSGFISARSKGNAVDYVMFARETLRKKAGDCDDLTVLYSSLLESVGINTAVVTIPGHVFMMFDSEIPANSYKEITDKKELIYVMNGTAWIPVEATMIGKTFYDAWKDGASKVSRYKGRGRNFEVVETSDAWNKFPPADIGGASSINLPRKDKINRIYAYDRDAFNSMSYEGALERLMAKVKINSRDYSSLNKIGIVYGRYRELEKAEEYFKKAVAANKSYTPAYTNLGNIYLLKKEFNKAINYYGRAVELKPSMHKYRINLARAYYENGRKFKAKNQYNIAVKKYPGYKRRYSYLGNDSAMRAADPEERLGYNLWIE